MSNEDRMIVKIIKEICQEEAIKFTSYSYDWILQLEKDGKIGFIFGYNFSINNTTSARICDDKCATSDILTYFGIPAVEHFFFMSPNNIHYIGEKGNWNKIIALFAKYETLVCKANEGSSGEFVFLVKNKAQLEKAIQDIFTNTRTMAISPFYDIIVEYRVIILNGIVKLIYAKRIPYVTGDGKSTIRQLIIKYMLDNNILLRIETIEDHILDKILKPMEEYSINWKSNLGQGAVPEIIDDKDLILVLTNISLKVAEAISIDFASIDIIKTSEGFKVLEVNCGIMMENFIRYAPGNYAIAKDIYRTALMDMMSNKWGSVK